MNLFELVNKLSSHTESSGHLPVQMVVYNENGELVTKEVTNAAKIRLGDSEEYITILLGDE